MAIERGFDPDVVLVLITRYSTDPVPRSRMRSETFAILSPLAFKTSRELSHSDDRNSTVDRFEAGSCRRLAALRVVVSESCAQAWVVVPAVSAKRRAVSVGVGVWRFMKGLSCCLEWFEKYENISVTIMSASVWALVVPCKGTKVSLRTSSQLLGTFDIADSYWPAHQGYA